MEIRVLHEETQRKLTNQMICYGGGSGPCSAKKRWIIRKTETKVRKDLAPFLPHMSLAFSAFITLWSEAGLWFAIEAEYLPKGSWTGFSLAVVSWLCMDECSRDRTGIVFNCSVCIWLSWILLQGTLLFLLFTWVFGGNTGSRYRSLNKICLHVCWRTHRTTEGEITFGWCGNRPLSRKKWAFRPTVDK